jgi:hypothetical protein
MDAIGAVHQGSGGKLTAGRPRALAARAGSSSSSNLDDSTSSGKLDGASLPAPAVRAMGDEKSGKERREEGRARRGADGEGEEKEEGTFDMVFSQLEVLRLLQVVLR